MTFKTLHPRTADGILTIDTLANLNLLAAPQLGDIRFVLSEDANYSYTSGGWVEVAGGGGGGGGVNGPVSSTNNTVALWSGTGGDTLKNSVTVVDPATGVTTGISMNADGAGNSITNIENADIKAGAAIDATKIANGSVSNTEFQYLDGVTSAIQTQFTTMQTDVNSRQLSSQKGNANGYASLDGGGKVPVAQLPSTVMTYEGTWSATTNTPTLANGTGDAGAVYIVNGAGSVNFGAGDGTIWQKSDNADDVVSVNGLTGVVTLDAAAVDAIAEMGTVTNHRLVKTQGTTGQLVEQTGVTVTNSNHMSGVTQLDVDNVRVDLNTVSATTGALTLTADTDVIVDPAGDSFVVQNANSVQFRADGSNPAALTMYDGNESNFIQITIPSTVTANRTPQIPDDTGNFVLTSATQVITAKDIDGGTASNTSRITIPKDTKTNLDALTRKEATVVFASDEDRLYVDNGTSLVAVSSSTATGTGETNYITNPSAVAAITGWTNVGDLDVFRTTTASELPREYTTAAGIKIISDPNAQSTADYVYFDFTLDDVDLNKKLKIQWSQKQFGAYVAGQLAVVITTQADRTTAVATPDITAIPAYDGVFTASFDTALTATLSLVIRATTDMATDTGIVISDVIVGPGQVVNAAPIGPWTSFTPTGSWSTNTTYTGSYRRVGDTAEFDVFIQVSGAPTSASLTVNLPSGMTIDTTKTQAGALNAFGIATIRDTATATYNARVLYSSTTAVAIYYGDDAASGVTYALVNQAAPMTWATSDFVQMRFSVPIAEWAGAPNYAGVNDVEYAFNTSVTDAADTTSFGYGQAGGTFPGTLTVARLKRVRFLTPIEAGDQFFIQVQESGSGPWLPETSLGAGYNPVSATGMRVIKVSGSTTDVDVQFLRYINGTTNWGSSEKYRIIKARSGAAVGFGAATATSNGLLQPPTSIEDVKATQMGLKSYAHGTTYNGGNAPTITLSAGGGTLSSISHSSFIPYQIQSGAWRLKGQFTAVVSATARTAPTFAVAGLSVSASYDQPVFATATPGVGMTRMRIQTPFTVQFDHNSVSTTQYYAFFDVELTAKPTWAY